MFAKIAVGCLMVLSIVVSAGTNCNADDKNFVWTYEYSTMPKDKLEMEIYMTTEIQDIADMSSSIWKWQIELEYGVTESFDIAIYEMFKQKIGTIKSFEYEGYKLRGRYKLFTKDYLPLNILLYGEIERGVDLAKPAVLEGKIILARTEGRLNISYNQVIKQNMEPSAAATHSFYAGMSYEIENWLTIGLELKGNYSSVKQYFGPTICVISPLFYINSGIIRGINIGNNEVQSRTVFGIMF